MDLYAVLGVDRGASFADIKRAYRRLARRYHPGINPGDRTAEAMFRAITEAYETLVDPVRREQYDATGVRSTPGQVVGSLEFAGFDFSSAAHGPQAATFTELFAELLHPMPAETGRPEPGADLHAAVTVSFLDALSGVQRQIVVTRQDTCASCQGAGHVPTPEGRCATCHGTGAIRWARGHMVFSKTCNACHGSGRQRRQRCAMCAGHGRVVRSDSISVLVPPGIADGGRLRLAGQGHAGRFGGATGDLYVTVHVTPHPLFRREGDDIHMDVPVAVHEAVLGARIEVPSPEAPVKVRIPPGSQSGQQFRLRERGLPTPAGTRGDLVVHVRLVLPSSVDERSKELMREFGARNNEDVRRDLFAEMR